MTQIDQMYAATAALSAAVGIAAPAWRTRRIAGVDAVAGDPPVPLSVWYVAGGDRPVAADPAGDGWPAELARQTVAGLTSPGDLVMDVDGDDAVRVAAVDQQCRYLPLPGPAQPRQPGGAAGTADLVALRWPRHPALPDNPPSTAVVDLLGACRTLLLVTGGYVAVALTPPPAGVPFIDPAAPLLAAAPAAGLGYLQHIVALDRPLAGDRLATDPQPPGPDAAAALGRHLRVHRDVVVLVLQAGRHG